jgi:hypothetical protein
MFSAVKKLVLVSVVKKAVLVCAVKKLFYCDDLGAFFSKIANPTYDFLIHIHRCSRLDIFLKKKK